MCECLNSCNEGFYTNDKKEKVQLTDLINNCLEKTEFYEDNHEYDISKQNNKQKGMIEVRKESTLQAAYRFCAIENKKSVCALNSSNSVMPGGLVLYGMTAQALLFIYMSFYLHSKLSCLIVFPFIITISLLKTIQILICFFKYFIVYIIKLVIFRESAN